MSNNLIFDLYKKLHTAYRSRPIMDARDIVNKIGIIGVDSNNIISELLESGLVTRVGGYQYRLNTDRDILESKKDLIDKANKRLVSVLSESLKCEKYGLGENQVILSLKEEEVPAEPVSEPTVPDEVPAPVPTQANKIQDHLKVETSYVAPSEMEASSLASELKKSLKDKGADLNVNLSNINPFSLDISGDPGDVSMAEFYLTTVLFGVLTDKTDVSKLKIEKERSTQLVS